MPHADTLPGRNRLAARSRFTLLLLVTGLLLCSGCTGGSGMSPSVETARKHLQLNRPKLAVEALVKEDSAEGHYLKSVALHALGQNAAAREQIAEALSINGDDPKYRGYEAVLEMSAGKKEAAGQLIELFDRYPSSGALAFFVTRAYVAKGDLEATLRAFRLGQTLIDEVPEFMFSALMLAVKTEDAELIRGLLEKLERAAPDDAAHLRLLLNIAVMARQVEPAEKLLQRITALEPQSPELPELQVKMELLLDRPEAALVAANEALKNTPDQTSTQMLLAEALLRADPKPEREQKLAELARNHPEEPDFLRRYALYLVRQDRIPEALAQINQVLQRTKLPSVRARLLNLAIRIPVEEANVELSEKQLELYRKDFSNPLVAEYFQGRIDYMKGDFPAAMAAFERVIASPAMADSEADQLIAAECVAWQKRILKAQNSQQRLQKAQEELKALMQGKGALPAPLTPPGTSNTPATQPTSPLQPTSPSQP